MTYKTGNVANSHQLASLVQAAMIEAGWSVVSDVGTSAPDCVFYSSGEDGNQDIYVRAAAGLSDTQSHGDIQFPANDGYTGYVNLFSYQYFPSGGSVSNGVGELGKYGPILYASDSRSSGKAYEEYNLFTSSPSGRNIRDLSYSSVGTKNLTDGHRWWFDGLGGYNYIMRFDHSLYPEPGYTTLTTTFFVSRGAYTGSCFSKKSPREPMAWCWTYGNYGGFTTYNRMTYTESPYTDSVYAQAPWGTGYGGYSQLLQGTRRTGRKLLYVTRGYQTNQWAIYDMDENKWYSQSGLWTNVHYGHSALLVTKESTGYDNDRIYFTRGWDYKYFWSKALDDDGFPIGSWALHAETPMGQYTNDMLLYLGGNKIHYFESGQSVMRTWEFPANPEGLGSWSSQSFFNQSMSNATSIAVRDHLSCRAGVDEFELTPYWIFANKDRVVIVTKTLESSYSSDYELAYAGLFDTFSDVDTTPLTSSATAGQSFLEVENTSMFRVGASYKIVGLDSGRTVTLSTGASRRVGNVEKITISSVQQSSSRINLSSPIGYDYASGSKVGWDVQPVCVVLDSLDRIQTTNAPLNSSNLADNHVYQTYLVEYPQQSLTTSADRDNASPLWPILLRHDAIYKKSGTQMTKSDIRGSLSGVFFTGGIGNEGIVQYDGKNYMSFSLESYKLGRIAVGPME